MDSSDASGNSDSSPLDSERFPVIQHRTCHIDELIWPESRRRFGGTLPHSSKRRGRMLQAFPLAFRGTRGRKLKQSKAAGIDDPLRTSENKGKVSRRIVSAPPRSKAAQPNRSAPPAAVCGSVGLGDTCSSKPRREVRDPLTLCLGFRNLESPRAPNPLECSFRILPTRDESGCRDQR